MPGKRTCTIILLILAAAGAVAWYALKPPPNPVRAVYPPDPASIPPPGTEKFIVLSYTLLKQDSARLWEYIPDQASAGMTLRCEFLERGSAAISSLLPTIPGLLYLYTGDGPSPGSGPIQRHVKEVLGFGFKPTWLPLLVDYRAWTVRTLDPPGEMNTNVPGVFASGPQFCIKSEEGFHSFSRDGRALGILTMRIVDDFGWCWLIQEPNGTSAPAFLFNPETRRRIRPFNLGAYRKLAYDTTGTKRWAQTTWLSRDGNHLAGCEWIAALPTENNPGYPPVAIPATIRVCDIRQKALHEYPVNLLVRNNTQYQREHIGLYCRFTDDGRLTYSSAARPGKQEYDWMKSTELSKHLEEVSIDLATWQMTRRPVPPAEMDPIPFNGRSFPYLPDYLTALESRLVSDELVTQAFLVAMKQVTAPEEGCAVEGAGFSRDGRRFLCKMHHDQLSGDFFYGDLKTREVRRIPAPAPHLKKPVQTEILWIRSP
jgi:hypothetical protein